MQVQLWYEKGEENKREVEYLNALKEDLDVNNQNFDNVISYVKRTINSMHELLKLSEKDEPDLPLKRLNELMKNFQSMPTYNDTDRTYTNMTGSGDLRLIKDKELKSLIANYYAQLRTLYVVQQAHEMELVYTFQPYVISNLDYRDVAHIRGDSYSLEPRVAPISNKS